MKQHARKQMVKIKYICDKLRKRRRSETLMNTAREMETFWTRKRRRNKNIKIIFSTVLVLLTGIIVFYLYNLTCFLLPWYYEYSKGDLSLQNKSKYLVKNVNYLIETQGCTVLNYTMGFPYKQPKIFKHSCGKRAIFIKRISDKKIQFIIDKVKLESPKLNFMCYYRYGVPSSKYGREDTEIEMLKYKAFENGTIAEFEQELITVHCRLGNNRTTTRAQQQLEQEQTVFHKDSYIIIKKKNLPESRKKLEWNVLMLGMNTMSRGRAYQTMPETTGYLKKLGWLDFRAYHKIAADKYSNLITILTGQTNVSREIVNKLLIWNTFKNHGYVTAYGEDEIETDTFTSTGGFRMQPTDHYMRPLFLTGEKTEHNIVCTGKLSSGEHLLQYSYDFAETYYRTHPFFGLFWMNSFSHDLKRDPSRIDKQTRSFFEKLYDSGILNKTFVIFLSDHGLRFGKQFYPFEAFYDERYPMLFMWIPQSFKRHSSMYVNSVINQMRLVTPYDLFATLQDILKISNEHYYEKLIREPPACRHCISIFTEHSASRSCANATITNKWCACHPLTPVNNYTEDVNKAIDVMARHVEKRVESIPTKNCTKCAAVSFKTALRVHLYENEDKKFFVIAIRVSVTNLYYEGVVSLHKFNYKLEDDVEVISVSYNNKLETCTVQSDRRVECKCIATCTVT